MQDLKEESIKATELLKGRKVQAVVRHNPSEVVIQFTDGSRLFIDVNNENLELSITGIKQATANAKPTKLKCLIIGPNRSLHLQG